MLGLYHSSCNNYYRLKQIDFDGTLSYSEIKAVAGQGQANNINVNIYPNPVSDALKIRINALPEAIKTAKIQIIDVTGQVVSEFNTALQSYQLLEIHEVEELLPAIYLLSIEMDNGETFLQKFVKN